MSERIEQVNEHLRAEFSILLPREVELPNDSLVTVTRVEASRDLKHATVYISILPEDHEAEIFSFLRKQLPNLQKELASKLTMKCTPKLKLAIDDVEKHASQIDELLDNISNEL